jgi:hypothetical protein
MTYLSRLISTDFLAPNRESKISKFSFEAYAVLDANPTQGPPWTSDVFFLVNHGSAFYSATEQDSGRKDTARSLTCCQYQEGGLVQRDACTSFPKRAKQQQHKRLSFRDAEQRNHSQLIQLVRTTDFPADQDPGHGRCGAPIYHHICVSLFRVSYGIYLYGCSLKKKKQLGDDVYARGIGNGMSETEASAEGICAPALG